MTVIEGELPELSLTTTDEKSKNLIEKFNKLIVNYNTLYTDNKDNANYKSQIKTKKRKP